MWKRTFKVLGISGDVEEDFQSSGNLGGCGGRTLKALGISGDVGSQGIWRRTCKALAISGSVEEDFQSCCDVAVKEDEV